MVAREAGPGDSLGVAAALTGRPIFAGAAAIEASELLAIPVAEATDAFRLAPDLALALLRELSGQDGEDASGGWRPPLRAAAGAHGAVAPVAAAGSGNEPPPAAEQPDDGGPATAAVHGLVRIPGSFNEEWFFVQETTCPVSATAFEYLRTRAGAMHPIGRDSDFRVAYRSVDPTRYSVIVCPGCSFAAYPDDFETLEADEREAMLAAQPQRDAYGRPNLCGERSLEAAALALTLARACYELREAGPRRRAGLLHRQAWLERERGQAEAEHRLLREARDAYVEAFEQDADLTDAAAVRAVYVIGDLYLRLDDPLEGARWLESCVQMPEVAERKGLERIARERLADARELLGRLKESA